MVPFDDDTRMRDARLLAAYAAGDHAAARELMALHVPRVLNLARRMLQNEAEAEEIAQETMLRLWKIAPDWREGEAMVSTWLYRVAGNLCRDKLRRADRNHDELDTDPEDGRAGVEDKLMEDDRMGALKAALAELPERQRLAVVLRHLEERSNPEIAEIMDLSVEAVESLISRGKRALTQAMRPRGDELGYER